MNVAYAIPVADTWGMHGDVGWGWMVGMMVLMVLFWGAIILGVVWLVRGAGEARSGPRSSSPTDVSERRETPTEVLDRRFAEGTISLEDYQARREVLANDAGDASGTRKEEPLVASRAGEGSHE